MNYSEWKPGNGFQSCDVVRRQSLSSRVTSGHEPMCKALGRSVGQIVQLCRRTAARHGEFAHVKPVIGVPRVVHSLVPPCPVGGCVTGGTMDRFVILTAVDELKPVAKVLCPAFAHAADVCMGVFQFGECTGR